jgi:glutathione synthase/RimK-type ligase-like ATP-grasp enzyme
MKSHHNLDLIDSNNTPNIDHEPMIPPKRAKLEDENSSCINSQHLAMFAPNNASTMSFKLKQSCEEPVNALLKSKESIATPYSKTQNTQYLD